MVASPEHYEAELHVFSSSPRMLLDWTKNLPLGTGYQIGVDNNRIEVCYAVYLLYVGSDASSLCRHRGHGSITRQQLEEIIAERHSVPFNPLLMGMHGNLRPSPRDNYDARTSISPIVIPRYPCRLTPYPRDLHYNNLSPDRLVALAQYMPRGTDGPSGVYPNPCTVVDDVDDVILETGELVLDDEQPVLE